LVQVVFFFVFVIFWGILFYWIGKQMYDNDEVKENFDRMHFVISN